MNLENLLKNLIFRLISTYLRHTPFDKGRWTLMVIAKKLAKDRFLSGSEKTITTTGRTLI